MSGTYPSVHDRHNAACSGAISLLHSLLVKVKWRPIFLGLRNWVIDKRRFSQPPCHLRKRQEAWGYVWASAAMRTRKLRWSPPRSPPTALRLRIPNTTPTTLWRNSFTSTTQWIRKPPPLAQLDLAWKTLDPSGYRTAASSSPSTVKTLTPIPTAIPAALLAIHPQEPAKALRFPGPPSPQDLTSPLLTLPETR